MATLVPSYLIPYGTAKVIKSRELFTEIINDFGGENAVAQIRAAGKVKLISDAVEKVIYYGLQVGSLEEAFKACEQIKITPEMAPFITEARKQDFKNKLVEAMSKL